MNDWSVEGPRHKTDLTWSGFGHGSVFGQKCMASVSVSFLVCLEDRVTFSIYECLVKCLLTNRVFTNSLEKLFPKSPFLKIFFLWFEEIKKMNIMMRITWRSNVNAMILLKNNILKNTKLGYVHRIFFFTPIFYTFVVDKKKGQKLSKTASRVHLLWTEFGQ